MSTFVAIISTCFYLSVAAFLWSRTIEAVWEVQNDWKEWVLAKSWCVGFIFWISIPIGYGLSNFH